MNFSDVFQGAKQFYDQLSPQQRQTVAQQFQQHFGGSADPQLQQQAQSLDSSNPDPQQLGQLHDYAQQNDPSGLDRAMDHPDLRDAMSQQGVTGWGGQDRAEPDEGRGDQDQPYQDQPYQDQGYQQQGYQQQGDQDQGYQSQQGGGYRDQGGYESSDQGFGPAGADRPDQADEIDQYGDQGGGYR